MGYGNESTYASPNNQKRTRKNSEILKISEFYFSGIQCYGVDGSSIELQADVEGGSVTVVGLGHIQQ
jgi:hypothetical protein